MHSAGAPEVFLLLETESMRDIEAHRNGWYGNRGTDLERYQDSCVWTCIVDVTPRSYSLLVFC